MINFENFFTGVAFVILLGVVLIVIFGLIALSAEEMSKFIYGTTPIGTPERDPSWWMYFVSPVLFLLLLWGVVSFFSWIGSLL